jgi:hypothetical protein
MFARILGTLLLLAASGYFALAARHKSLRPAWDTPNSRTRFSMQSCIMAAAVFAIWAALLSTAGWLVPVNFAKYTFGVTVFVASGYYWSDFARDRK